MFNEREYLRDLAKKQLELSQLPIMREREKLWYDHNELKGDRPMISFEEGHYWGEMAPELKCEDPFHRYMEEKLQHQIHRVEMIGDDRVVPDFFETRYEVLGKYLGLGQKDVRSKNKASDGTAGYHIIPQIEVIEEDFHKVQPTKFRYLKNL